MNVPLYAIYAIAGESLIPRFFFFLFVLIFLFFFFFYFFLFFEAGKTPEDFPG